MVLYMWEIHINDRNKNQKIFLQRFLVSLKNRKVFLWGENRYWIIFKGSAALKYLYNKDGKNPIILYVNSGGGEVEAGLLL